ncbi:hypothetical protein Taro_037568 [Colocasia esculenta]|uniref:Uncharacterized protein n=1 Tax=Colocasia esculenta TaxID=4460 RepID=A0A843W0X2_COLES|nr:hypothetical protein [Colocasia esculenta]
MAQRIAASDEMEAYIATVQSHEREKAMFGKMTKFIAIKASLRIPYLKLAGKSGSVDPSVK